MKAGPQTWRVAEFARTVRWEDLPADVRLQVIRCALDLCGAAVAGSRTEAAQTAAAYALYAHATGPSTIIGTGASSTPVGAALANGFAASALDIDDGYRPVKGHPGAVVFPAVLAAAEEAKSSGVGFLTALVVGYEVAMRAGRVLHSLYDFYHGSGAWAPIGAAAGVARLLGCDAEQTWHALGIAEFHAAMTPEMRSVDHPSMLKDGIGWGAMVGNASGQLAARGFTGIPALFDADHSGPRLTESLGDEYLILDLYFKPYACCRWAQPAIEGALSAARHIGATAADVARVRVHTFEAATHLRCASPRTTEEAQFSLPWPIACALIDGVVGPDQVTGESLSDAARRQLASRVEVVVDAELEKVFPEEALAWVEIETMGGSRARSGISAAPGDAGTLFPDRELVKKFMDLT
ncbi:MAG: MmgE/PrpD family protein, partial [Actinobacteria bacterium]|nr:MmgE/PrpD family protein [Actinomycetota bacterium]